jgi:PPOX class probable F420-dependent enzyme
VTPEEARRRFAASPVARLATAGADLRPHVVPIVFALEGERILSAVDHKAKRSTALRRLRNIAENPSVSVLVDHYEDDWDRLWWVRADGVARVVPAGVEEARRAVALLAARYDAYVTRPPAGPFVVIEVRRWSSWSAAPPVAEPPPAPPRP